MKKIKCENCGYEWIPKVKNPKQCPTCKRYRITWRTKKVKALKWENG